MFACMYACMHPYMYVCVHRCIYPARLFKECIPIWTIIFSLLFHVCFISRWSHAIDYQEDTVLGIDCTHVAHSHFWKRTAWFRVYATRLWIRSAAISCFFPRNMVYMLVNHCCAQPAFFTHSDLWPVQSIEWCPVRRRKPCDFPTCAEQVRNMPFTLANLYHLLVLMGRRLNQLEKNA